MGTNETLYMISEFNREIREIPFGAVTLKAEVRGGKVWRFTITRECSRLAEENHTAPDASRRSS